MSRRVARPLALLLLELLIAGCGAPPAPGERRAEITQGTPDADDPGVVALFANNTYRCSGTLVSPRVVATAAHCFENGGLDSVYFGATPPSGGATLTVAYERPHPAFDPALLTNDVGLLVLAADAPAPPSPAWMTPFDASFVGGSIRLVGFGRTSIDDTSAPQKRQGATTISSYTDVDFTFHGMPSQTCLGDSGGAAFLSSGGTDYLVGVTSGGDAHCTDYGQDMRVDAYRDFFSSFIAQTSGGAATLGQRCFYPENCASGQCLAPEDAPTVQYCTTTCHDDHDCPSPMTCGPGGQCRYRLPSPGAFAASCQQDSDCDQDDCAQKVANGPHLCSASCDDRTPCAKGFVCGEDLAHTSSTACFPVPSGCSFSGARTGPIRSGA